MSINKSCYLLGEKSLLIQCANILQEQGFDIKCVVSNDASIRSWATSHNIHVIFDHQQQQLIELGAVDYIFSITHLKIISPDVLALAKNTAINFHDGPLPNYAGLNVTSWAIFNGEQQHGIRWHEMIADVDEGQIYKQVDFELDQQETAFTLNAKCYEAALNSFGELIEDIVSNTLQASAQPAGDSAFYARCHRMPAMSIIDWNKPANDILNMIRALDFGPYDNPISEAKLTHQGKTVYIQEAELREQSATAGEVIQCDSELVIACQQHAISITRSKCPQGVELDAAATIKFLELNSADKLQALNQDDIQSLEQLDKHLCRYEPRWVRQLRQLDEISLPFAQRSNADASLSKNTQTLDQNNIDLGSRFILFLSRLNCKDQFNAYLNFTPTNTSAAEYIENCAPAAFTIDYTQAINELLPAFEAEFTHIQNMGGYSKDLFVRTPELSALPQQKNLIVHCSANTELRNDAPLQVVVQQNQLDWHYDNNSFTEQSIQYLQDLFANFVARIQDHGDQTLADIHLLSTDEEDKILQQWNATDSSYDNSKLIHQLFEDQVAQNPDAIALSFGQQTLTYQQLNQRANQIAHYLVSQQVNTDQLVGVLLDRSIDMIVSMMGILKAGAAYLPLDPTYPEDRIQYMLEDAQVACLITQNEHLHFTQDLSLPNILVMDEDAEKLKNQPQINTHTNTQPQHLAYTIYTSGSTGKPKGVMVEHRNVVNFFDGMDHRLGKDKGVWLAVTSISFDISVLEIFWTLGNGFEVALFSDADRKASKKVTTAYPDQDIQFSLFYWNVAEDESDYDDEPYRLLMESAKFGDRNGFTAVWTPERHFHAFGGLYPNPAVTSAALAAATENIQIRAGSCVLPLHSPIRVAEDWAVIDNISNGRVGMAFAAGWQPNDFAIMPQNHADAKNIMFESMEKVKQLWRGETLNFPGPKGDDVAVRTLPRPKQKELPVWVTTAGNPETFRQAGASGSGVLTHLLGQSVEDVDKNIQVYRDAYKEAGHEGEGHVTLLLHTLVGKDEEAVRELARAPMKKYLKSAMFLVKAAAWNFPTFKAMSEESGQTLDEFFENISDEDMDGLLDFAFARYYETSGLFGTPERCLSMVDRLKEIGVNEIGCLIDYGLDTDNVLNHLPHLNTLRKAGCKQLKTNNDVDNDLSIAEIIQQRQVTHLQCTPSMANMLLADEETANQLPTVKHMMVGGEALTVPLAQQLTEKVQDRLTNMYGPTETTIWSSTQDIAQGEEVISIGKPISNTQVYILDKYLKPVPQGVTGELYIGGAGVVRGYHQRQQLTNERFIANPFSDDRTARIYNTGDLACFDNDGRLMYMGRADHQIKIRGYRIELGEIEALLNQHNSVAEAVVLLREDTEGDKRLVAYIKPTDALDSGILKSILSEDLPEFMVPSIFVDMQAMPLTPNGKIDRKALPKPQEKTSTSSAVSYVQPENELQQQIAEIWQKALHLSQVGLDDNFFDIGGHSLLVVEVLNHVRKVVEAPVKMTDMFRFPTIRQFSQYLGSDNNETQEKLNQSQDRAEARKSARKTAINRRRARQK